MIETINNKKFLTISTSELIKEFKNYIGQPYVYGGDGTLKPCASSSCTHHNKNKKYVGYDCSGYIYKVLSKWNYNKFGRSTSQMMDNTTCGEWIYDINDLKVGDLMFFTGHVGVVSNISNHIIKMYHSPKCGKTICEVDSSYRKDFIKGLRILKSNLSVKNEKDGGSMKICVVAGHTTSGKGTGAVGHINESTENRIVAKKVVEYLKQSGHEADYYEINKADNYLQQQVAFANKKSYDLVVQIHFNAGGGVGTETLYSSSRGEVYAKKITDSLGKAYKQRGAKKRTDLYWLNNTKDAAVLVECCFVDSKVDTDKYKSDKSLTARLIAEGIIGKSIATPKPPSDEKEIWYRAVAGSFKSKELAEKRVQELTDKGYSGCFVVAFEK